MKRIVTLILFLGMLIVSVGIVSAATLNITANVSSALILSLSDDKLLFDNVLPGAPSLTQQLTATTAGTSAYQLTLSCSEFKSRGVTEPASVLQFKEAEETTYKNASTSAQNMLTSPGMATVEGDQKVFDMRVYFPATALNGQYKATVTISAIPM